MTQVNAFAVGDKVLLADERGRLLSDSSDYFPIWKQQVVGVVTSITKNFVFVDFPNAANVSWLPRELVPANPQPQPAADDSANAVTEIAARVEAIRQSLRHLYYPLGTKDAFSVALSDEMSHSVLWKHWKSSAAIENASISLATCQH